MAAAADRLSALPDDALQRVLSFAPAREAAASAILSRRWRTLWSRTSAVNLDSRPYTKAQHARDCYPVTFHAFFRDAQAVLAGRRGGTGLKMLNLFLETAAYCRPQNSGYYNRTRAAEPEVDGKAAVAGLLADPALARLEELSIAHDHEREYTPPDSLPCGATLRVLELRRCSVHPPSYSDTTFPSLTDLTMDECYFSSGDLQVMLDAAPALTRLALVNISQRSTEYLTLPLRLRCSTAIDLVVVQKNLSVKELEASANGSGIELDMPSLRSFRYLGYPIKLSLTSPTPGLARVDLDVAQRHQLGSYSLKYEPPARMLTGFSSTRVLKLNLKCIEDLIVDDCGVVLPTFPNLELLELEAELQQYNYQISNTAAAMATLLRSCPAMSELRLRLDTRLDQFYYHERKHGGPYGESVERFERLVSMSSEHRAAMQLDGVSELPDVLSKNCALFRSLRKSLRKVTLQFKAKKVNCFQVQFAKFLVENAMGLEEMHIDDGSQFLPDHLLDKVERWRADAFRRRDLQSDTAAGFRAYELHPS
ncbi:unnamed protein product [Alopecurus aequalis]